MSKRLLCLNSVAMESVGGVPKGSYSVLPNKATIICISVSGPLHPGKDMQIGGFCHYVIIHLLHYNSWIQLYTH